MTADAGQLNMPVVSKAWDVFNKGMRLCPTCNAGHNNEREHFRTEPNSPGILHVRVLAPKQLCSTNEPTATWWPVERHHRFVCCCLVHIPSSEPTSATMQAMLRSHRYQTTCTHIIHVRYVCCMYIKMYVCVEVILLQGSISCVL